MNVIVRYNLCTRHASQAHPSEIVQNLTFPAIFLPVRQKEAPSPKLRQVIIRTSSEIQQIDPISDILPNMYQANRCVMRVGHITDYVHPASAETPSRSYYVQTLKYIHSFG